MTHRHRAFAFAFAAFAAFASASAANAQTALPPPPGCTPALKDVRTGSGASGFASHYVTVGSYGYGEFAAGGSGGQSLWQKRGTLWCRVPTGAAALDGKALRGLGVPSAIVDRLIALMRKTPEIAPVRPQAAPHR